MCKTISFLFASVYVSSPLLIRKGTVEATRLIPGTPGKMQLVLTDIHGVNHLGGNKLWGEGIR
ncbi:hypothetical protein ABEY64_00380 [Bacillus mycoides]